MPQFSLPWLLAFSGTVAAVLIPIAFGAMSMTKVLPASFQVARFCFGISAILPAVTVWYVATQFQISLWLQFAIATVGAAVIGLLLGYLLRLVNENEQAHSETQTDRQSSTRKKKNNGLKEQALQQPEQQEMRRVVESQTAQLDERHAREILGKVVELLKEPGIYPAIDHQALRKYGMAAVPPTRSRRLDPIGALIECSHDFNNEEEVVWVCKELANHPEHTDPFLALELRYGGGMFDGKRLKFIRDAKMSRRSIETEAEALCFLGASWAKDNGLPEIPWSPSPKFHSVVKTFSPLVDQQELYRLLQTTEQRTKEIRSSAKQGILKIPLIESELLDQCNRIDDVLTWGQFNRLALVSAELNNELRERARFPVEQRTPEILNAAQVVLQSVAAMRYQIANAKPPSG